MMKSVKLHFATGFKILLFIVGFALLYMLAKSTLSDMHVVKAMLIAYAGSVAACLQWFVEGLQFDTTSGNLIYNQQVFRTLSGLAIKFYIIAFAVLFFMPRRVGKTFVVFLIASAVLYVLGLLRFVNDMFSPASLVNFFFSVIVGLRYLTIYFVVKYKIGLHNSLQTYFDKINAKVQAAFHFSFHKLLIIVSLLPAITGFFDWFLIAKWNYFVTALSHLILWLSNAMLWLLGYSEAYIYGNYILLGNYWLYLGTNCLGVGIMVVFATLIFAIRSPFANRLVFGISGLILLLLLNAARIVGILLYIFLNQVPQHLIEDYHNFSNNLFYAFVFVILLFYINKFQYLKLSLQQKSKQK